MSILQNKIANWLEQAGIRINGPNRYDLQVHDPRFYRRALLDGSLGFGESYMDGWWSCDDLEELVYRIINSDVRRQAYRHPAVLFNEWLNRFRNDQTRSRSRRVAERHYDLDNDLFGAFLGQCRNYSCGYYSGTNVLDEAQRLKLDLICRKLQLRPGDRLLEIGGGWGEFALYAAKVWGAHVTSINISEEQMQYARKLCAGYNVEIVRSDYRDISGHWDKIAAIAMLPHVGQRNHRLFMETMRRALKPDGIFLIESTINTVSTTYGDPWIDRYIFPGLLMPSGAQVLAAAENLLVLEDLHNFGPHYVITLRAWNSNLHREWSRFEGRYGDRVLRMFEYFFMVSAALFRARTMEYWHMVFTPQGAAQPPSRISCAECAANSMQTVAAK
jgi:cyclopropane-fatty-acyl-phospholipid synthase